MFNKREDEAKKVILRNATFLSGSNLAKKLISFAVSVLIANYFGPSGYGKIAYAISLVTLFVFLPDLGISTLTIREVARNKKESNLYLGTSLFLRSFLAFLTYVLIIITALLLRESGDSLILVAIIGGMMVANTIGNCFENISTAFERMELNAIINTGKELILLSGVLIVLFTKRGLVSAGVVYLIASLVALIAWIIITPKAFVKPIFRVQFRFMVSLIRRGIPFALSGIFLFIYFRVDSVMLKLMKGVEEVGYYNAPYNLVYAFVFFPASLTAALFPRFSRYSQEDKDRLRRALSKTLSYLLIISLPLALGGVILKREVLLLFYQERYTPAIPVFSILLLAVVLIWLNYTLITTLNSMGKEKMVAKISGIALMVNIALNIFLIPSFGARGAAGATFFTEAFLLLAAFFAIREEIPLSFSKVFPLKAAVGALLMSFLTYFLKRYSLAISLTASSLFYLFFLLTTGAISKEDREALMFAFVRRGR